MQGTAHQKNGVPCQDAHTYQIVSRGTLLAAVSDGAGSAERSHAGSVTAANQVVVALAAALAASPPRDETGWREVMTQAIRQTHETLLGFAIGENLSPRAYAATLTCAIATADRLIVGQVGDSVAVAQGMDGALFLAAQPQRGEFAGETYFLTMPEALEQMTIQVHTRPVKALALMSDGLVRLAFKLPDYVPAPQFFQPLWDFVAKTASDSAAQEQLSAFLESERICTRADDDKTLLLAVRR